MLLPSFKVTPGPNAFLDECEALVSIPVEDGSLNEDQLRGHLAFFGDLQSFSTSSGVRFSPRNPTLVPDRLIACRFSATL